MAQTRTQLDVDFINEERAADAREAYGDWRYEYEREEREADVPTCGWCEEPLLDGAAAQRFCLTCDAWLHVDCLATHAKCIPFDGDWKHDHADAPHERRPNRNVPVCDACHRDLWDCSGTDRCIDCGTLQVIGDEGREECPACKKEQP